MCARGVDITSMAQAMACGEEDRTEQGKSAFMQYDTGDRHVAGGRLAQARPATKSSLWARSTETVCPRPFERQGTDGLHIYGIPQISICGYEVLLGLELCDVRSLRPATPGASTAISSISLRLRVGDWTWRWV